MPQGLVVAENFGPDDAWLVLRTGVVVWVKLNGVALDTCQRLAECVMTGRCEGRCCSVVSFNGGLNILRGDGTVAQVYRAARLLSGRMPLVILVCRAVADPQPPPV